MPVAFHEILFPTDISYGATGGPEYSTDVVITNSGGEARNQNWNLPRARYQVGHGVKSMDQLKKLIAFFRARKGRAFGFRFKDWADYIATGQAVGTGDGANTSWQLYKTYTDDAGYTEQRKITKPVNGTVKVYVDGVLQTTGYSVDYATGVLAFYVAPAAGAIITADFEFDIPARFDSDKMEVNIKDFNVYSWDSVEVVEIRL